MATTPQQVYEALRNVSAASKGKKMSAGTAATLAAIAGAESHWNLAAVGDVKLQNAKWGPSYGVFQIRTLKAETGKSTARDINFLKGGLYNQAAAAYSIWSGQGLGAWSTYKSGAYKKYTAQVRAKSSSKKPAPAAPAPSSAAPNPKPSTQPDWAQPYNDGWTEKPGGKPKNRPLGRGPGFGAGLGAGDMAGAAGGQAGIVNVGAFPGGILDPLNWAGSLGGLAAGSAAGEVWEQVQPFAVTSLFVLGALALVVVGGTVLATPARQRLESNLGAAAGDAAKIGAMVA